MIGNPSTAPPPARIFQLSDGRPLGFAEYGKADGRPVFLFHGNPGSRYFWGHLPGAPFHPEVRLVIPDRPGYGQSPLPRGWTIAMWPGEVQALADHLGLSRFAVVGVSGGGPYALACAWKLPDRVALTALVSAVGPDVPSALRGIIRPVRMRLRLARRFPWVTRMDVAIMAAVGRRNPARYVDGLASIFDGSDRALLRRADIRSVYLRDLPEAFRQAGAGSLYDWALPSRWPIPLEQIAGPVLLWQAERDGIVGKMGQYMAARIRNCRPLFFPGSSHLWSFEHMPEVMERLMGLGAWK